MAMAARVFVTLLVCFFALDFCEIRLDERSEGTVIDRFIIHNGYYGRKVFRGKAWRKTNFSKSARKLSHRRAIYSFRHHGMDPFFTLILCGDVELNPDPTNQQKNSKPAKQDENQDFLKFLFVLSGKLTAAKRASLKIKLEC